MIFVEEYGAFSQLRRIGFGLTSATDNVAVELIFISDLTGTHGLF